ncbi:MAG: carbohydrate-binding domain-containing protein [Kiritimatiellae bacterium]|nr:carbohydrate-binding domain-containing protein [Kiritimatiellia bacterium]MDD5522560.1 carbohydrate-binding domain-containing protein [Kiritimatiellia bacterium]
MKKSITIISIVFMLMTLRLMAANAPRSEINLNGEWLMQKVDDLSALPKGDWKPVRVPGYIYGTNYERAWFKRTFDASTAWAGKRIKLHFGGVKFNSVVVLNGQKVGGNFGGYEPFDIDITGAIKLGTSNELLVGIHDWTGIFSEKKELGSTKSWDELRGQPKNALLSPIGGLFSLYGIWDDVTLRILPPVHVDDVFVKTSVRKKQINADVTIANEDASQKEITVKAQVLDYRDNTKELDLPESKITLKPGESKTMTISQNWPDPKLWSHLSPNLYNLRIEIVDHDICSTRFGFREFWIEKNDFYLNGTRINLLATSTWPQHKIEDKSDAAQMFRAIKDANCVAMRLHTQPWQKCFYEAADEVGVLIVVEGAVWCDQNYRFEDDKWWENYATHLHRTVDNLKNHPSIIMWSLENEILHCATWLKNKEWPSKIGLVKMGGLVKGWDPTRPITYEADMDVRGVTDVVGLHYPDPEYPKVNKYPNACYWMDEEIKMKIPLVDGPREMWKWDRAKPLYIGEFLWIPAPDASADTIFFGDEAYNDFSKYRVLAKAVSWKMQIEAYRWYGVNGICPWTMFEGPGGVLAREKNPLWVSVRDSYQPNAIFIKEYDSRFYAGDKITRTLVIYNDTFANGKFTLTWNLVCQGKTVADGKESVKLGPAEHKVLTVKFKTPSVTVPADATFNIKLLSGGQKVCFEDSKPYRVFPKTGLSVPDCCKTVIYDPEGKTGKQLSDTGLALQKISSLATIPGDANIVIIGEHALKASAPEQGRLIGKVNPDRDRLMEFVRGGGRVFVLIQTEYPDNLMPVQLSSHASTMTFPQTSNHPVLRNISADDLKFWRGDNLVSGNEIMRPMSGGCRPIVVSGSASGLSYSPLLELPRGKGTFILCQLKMMEKFDTEPVAKQIFQNTINYLATFMPDTRSTLVVSDSQDFKRLLTAMRLRFTDVTGKLAQSELPQGGLLIIAGDMNEITIQQKKIKSYLETGGRVIFHKLTPQDMEKLNEIFPKDVALQPHRGRVAKINWADTMTSGWTRESLYWLGKHEGPGYSHTPLADGVADYALVSHKTGPTILSLPATEMTTEGYLISKARDHIIMCTTGSVSKEIDITEDGRYGITIITKGTPLDGIWPMMQVALDDEVVNLVSVPSSDWITVSAPCELRKGRHMVKISFINDASKPGEDRNMFVKQVDIVRMPPGAEGFVGLTRPAFVARFDVGKGCAVLDEITWSSEERNTQKAIQYAQGLFTALGTDFEDAWGDVIGPDAFIEDKTMSGFGRQSDRLSLACSGYVTTKAVFATSGKYTFELVASGTSLNNIYPIVNVQLDSKPIGTIELKSDGWRPYTLDTEVSKGEHEIKLVFTNDEYRPPEDRNLSIQKLVIYKR